ncbi:Cytosolic sulfotransferase 13 [Raphanus sativus]|nr:Cytosolic sulfotransferase 13 [Raphanus sativus]
MSKSETTLSKLLVESKCSQECKDDLLSSLPRDRGFFAEHLYQYQGFWYTPNLLKGVLYSQKHFQAKDSDIILVSNPKSGTTWLKSLVFALVYRQEFKTPLESHPLLDNNPHTLVPFIEAFDFNAQDTSPRIFSTHIPLGSLPESIKESSCKVVYCCRNPKDAFVSLWHFMKSLFLKDMVGCTMEEMVSGFCRGSSVYGPFWDHALEYWKESQANPKKEREIEDGVLDGIIKLCSLENLSKLEVNTTGKLVNGMETKAFFRKGETGGWRDTLTPLLAEEIDKMTEEKLIGSSFRFFC